MDLTTDAEGQRSVSGRGSRTNTLAREGIVPVREQRATTGSKFGQAISRSYFSSDQQRSFSEISDSMGPVPQPKISPIQLHTLPKQLWVGFGDGWSQLTGADSGKRTKYGLHCVIESAPRRAYVCCYVPHIPEVYNAVTSSFPQYDIEVAIKAMKYGNSKCGGFNLLIGYQSAAQYLCIKCDTDQKVWSMAIKYSGGEIPLAVIPMDSLKSNCFYELLVQVRGDTISLDVNSSPLFTAVRIPDTLSIGGITGVLAYDSKFAMKGWKFRAITGHSGARESTSSKPGLSKGYNSLGQRPAEPGYPPPQHVYAYAPPAAQKEIQSDFYRSIRNQEYSPYSISPSSARVESDSSKKHSGGGVKSLSEIMGLTSPTRNDCSKLRLTPNAGRSSAQPSLASYISSGQQQLPNPTIYDDSIPREPWHPPRPPQTSHVQGMMRYSGVDASNIHQGELSGVRNKMQEYINSGVDSDSLALGHTNNSDHRQSSAAHFHSQIEVPLLSPIEQQAREVAAQLHTRHDKHIVETVMRDVIQRDLGVTFDDIAAVPVAKRLLHEAVILPLIMPEFFTGIREPWKGVLLFGPPGTGKTMLAKAVAGVNGSTFFSCSAASLISKYRGESEKIIKCLFEAARLCAPSIIFMDEVDALVASRGAEGEHEASRRLKTELFSEMDGIASNSCKSVMLLATTNCPWDLDEAMRRRLEKRIYIPLPDEAARAELFEICMRDVDVDTHHVSANVLATSTHGYSGADIRIICREAAMMPMRRLLLEKRPDEIQRLRAAGELVISKVQLHDFMTAIQNTSPSVSSTFDAKYLSWDREYGSR